MDQVSGLAIKIILENPGHEPLKPRLLLTSCRFRSNQNTCACRTQWISHVSSRTV